jgi:hypothetical protein
MVTSIFFEKPPLFFSYSSVMKRTKRKLSTSSSASSSLFDSNSPSIDLKWIQESQSQSIQETAQKLHGMANVCFNRKRYQAINIENIQHLVLIGLVGPCLQCPRIDKDKRYPVHCTFLKRMKTTHIQNEKEDHDDLPEPVSEPDSAASPVSPLPFPSDNPLQPFKVAINALKKDRKKMEQDLKENENQIAYETTYHQQSQCAHDRMIPWSRLEQATDPVKTEEFFNLWLEQHLFPYLFGNRNTFSCDCFGKSKYLSTDEDEEDYQCNIKKGHKTLLKLEIFELMYEFSCNILTAYWNLSVDVKNQNNNSHPKQWLKRMMHETISNVSVLRDLICGYVVPTMYVCFDRSEAIAVRGSNAIFQGWPTFKKKNYKRLNTPLYDTPIHIRDQWISYDVCVNLIRQWNIRVEQWLFNIQWETCVEFVADYPHEQLFCIKADEDIDDWESHVHFQNGQWFYKQIQVPIQLDSVKIEQVSFQLFNEWFKTHSWVLEDMIIASNNNDELIYNSLVQSLANSKRVNQLCILLVQPPTETSSNKHHPFSKHGNLSREIVRELRVIN